MTLPLDPLQRSETTGPVLADPSIQAYSLAFSPELEAEYLEDHDQRNLVLLRFAALIALLLYAVFISFDLGMQGRVADPMVFGLLLGVSCPPVLVLLLATVFRPLQPYAYILVLVMVILNGIALALIVPLGTQRGIVFPYEVLILNLLYAFFMTGMLFRHALPIAAAVASLYLVLDSNAGLAGETLFDRAFVLGSIVLVGAIGCYLRERLERRAWWQARQLREMSQRDSLTGLYNYRSFFDRAELLLRQARRDARPLALLLIDVDHFKRFNDCYGHLAGDECLRRVAAMIAGAARRPLDLAARLGGEEFALMLYDSFEAGARERAEALRREIAAVRFTHLDHDNLEIRVSIGLAICGKPDDVGSVEQFAAQADTALYRAKAEGRDRVAA